MGSEKLAVVAWAALLWAPAFAAYPADKPLVFETAAPTNDLKGSLAAEVRFAQSHVFRARPRKGDNQPHLVARRKTLLLVRPLKPDGASPMQASARDRNGNVLGSLSLDPPEKLPKTAYYLEGAPDEAIDFTPPAGATAVIVNGKDELEKLSEREGTFLSDRLRQSALVEIQTADGRWVRDIYLPDGADLDGKMVRVRSNAGYTSTIRYSGRSVVVSRDQTLQFKRLRGQWIREGELENQNLVYAADAWSGVLPAGWIVPGLTLQIRQGALSGELTNIEVGAPTELLIHTIDLGMLAPPRGQFDFAHDPDAHREYFQTAPVSRMIVSQYEPLYLHEVMLPSGT
jgi:hypothetical protein